MRIFQDTISFLLEKQLDACALRQTVIAGNVANVNTPNYKRRRVVFQEELKKAVDESRLPLRTTSARHIPKPVPLHLIEPQVVTEKGTWMRADRNNVDMEREMVDLAANTLLYRTAAGILGGRKNMLGYVIRGGR